MGPLNNVLKTSRTNPPQSTRIQNKKMMSQFLHYLSYVGQLGLNTLMLFVCRLQCLVKIFLPVCLKASKTYCMELGHRRQYKKTTLSTDPEKHEHKAYFSFFSSSLNLAMLQNLHFLFSKTKTLKRLT